MTRFKWYHQDMVCFHNPWVWLWLVESYASFSDRGDFTVVKWLPHCKCCPLLVSHHVSKNICFNMNWSQSLRVRSRASIDPHWGYIILDQLFHEVALGLEENVGTCSNKSRGLILILTEVRKYHYVSQLESFSEWVTWTTRTYWLNSSQYVNST